MGKDEKLDNETELQVKPYILEAGLDPDTLSGDRNFITQGLMLYNVIDKRRLELNDIKKGKIKLIFIITIILFFFTLIK